jgi:amidase
MRTRRTLVVLLPVATALGPARAYGAPGDWLGKLKGVDLQQASVLDLQQAMAKRRLTSVDLVQAYLARIKRYDLGNVKLNSVRQLNPRAVADAARLDAERRKGKIRGPLHGIPVLLKDNVGTREVPTTAGSIALAGSIPLHEATVTAKLKAAGAVILGKTNLSEFANWVDLSMPNGYSSLGGQVVNAYTEGDPSGSSSGSGVAGSMAFAAVTIGTETSGSILSPSHANGLVGVKPTLGLASGAGIIPLAPDFDVPGPMVRTVTDAAAILGAIATDAAHVPAGGYLPALKKDALKGVRLGVPSGTGSPVLEQAKADLRKAGATLVATDTLGTTGLVGIAEIGLIPNEFKWSLNEYLAKETVPNLRVRTLHDIVEYNKAHTDKVKYGQKLLEASDASPGSGPLATTSAVPVQKSSQAAVDSALLADDLDAIVELGPFNANIGAAAGYPTVIVPAGLTGDAPQGLSFLGPAYAEAKLLGYAYAYEQVSRRRVPPTSVNTDLLPPRC